ncbi:molybdenum cofactor guanylyltransferase [candidate division KSB1 bacterium]|nr:molybdenum cofactor guanylyltransferase [candidate division KSB1 bacterium]
MTGFQYAISGVILAGGKSKRFGSNKAFIKVQGIPIVQYLYNQLRVLLKNVNVITNSPEEFRQLGMPMYPDLIRDRGPIGGIHSALENSFSPWVFVTPCDLPCFSYKLLCVLAGAIGEAEAVCFTNAGKVEPLPALFHRKTLSKLILFMKHGDNSVHSFLDFCNTIHTPMENYTDVLNPEMLSNCNTRNEYKKLSKMLELR